jgi:hypothetical protein
MATARDLDAEMAWLAACIDARFQAYFELGAAAALPEPPRVAPGPSGWAGLLADAPEGGAARLALALAAAPSVRPRLLDLFFTRNTTFDRRFTEFGGADGTGAPGFVPTGETLAFLLGADSMEARLRVAALLDPGGPLLGAGLLRPPASADEEPLRAPLRLAPERLSQLLVGSLPAPRAGGGFPAERLETRLEWADLVLHPGTRAQLAEIEAWMRHGSTLMADWGLGRLFRPGYRSLFHGPPGTGKTMTAALLGKSSGRPVWRVDLSLMVSKYIGETEKNLARVFGAAESRDWILFFDEADALFGKRSETRDAHDRYANQEVSYLLQRIETFDGVAILASNFRDNMDAAFARRFESVVHFPMPRAEERRLIWERGLPEAAPLAGDVDLDQLARDHALSGGAIMSAVRHACLAALAAGGRAIGQAELVAAARREQDKEGRR